MGLAFPDKMTTLLELHRGNSWLLRQDLFRALSTNHRDGFFYTDEEGKTKCVSENAIMNALYDAHYWLLLEIKADRSKLTEFGLKAKDRGKVTPGHLSSVLADLLDEKTRKWTSDAKAMDLDGFLSEVRKLPLETIPTSRQLWLLLNKGIPEIFNRGRSPESA